jgi:high-affinity Fe2+/Pb2+ permease
LAGTVAYSEFFFYGLATPHMGKLSFTNLPVHVALCVVLGSLWGIVFGEWKGTSKRTRWLIAAGIGALLVGSGLMAWGSWLATTSTATPAATASSASESAEYPSIGSEPAVRLGKLSSPSAVIDPRFLQALVVLNPPNTFSGTQGI